jgi:hypothetical protein
MYATLKYGRSESSSHTATSHTMDTYKHAFVHCLPLFTPAHFAPPPLFALTGDHLMAIHDSGAVDYSSPSTTRRNMNDNARDTGDRVQRKRVHVDAAGECTVSSCQLFVSLTSTYDP